MVCHCPRSEHKKIWFKKFLTAYAIVAMTTIIIAILAVLFIFLEILLNTIKRDVYTTVAALEINISKEIVKEYILPHRVTIHNLRSKTLQDFSKIVDEYSII